MQKVFNWLVKVHQKSPFSVHKTISRFVGWCLFVPLFNSSNLGYVGDYNLVYFGFCWLAISTLVIDLLFLIKGQKESSYKSDAFFERSKVTKQSIDSYYKWMTVIKAILIIPMIGDFAINGMAGHGVIYYGIISLIMVPVVAYFCDFKPFMPSEPKIDLTTNDKPANYGIPGFDAAGAYSDSPTAIGGMSN